jgi:4-hydroxy-tetrahydrodipicolinate synthase
VEITPEMMAELATSARFAGLKDSSGSKENITRYPDAVKGKAMFVGNETLLWDALDAGWTGTISGAANVVPGWLSEIVASYPSGSARTKFELLLPVLAKIRSAAQPPVNKAILAEIGVLPSNAMRLPLEAADPAAVAAVRAEIEARLGSLK